MAEVSPAARAAARRMLLQEAGGRTDPISLAEAAERANARLRDRLASLIGPTGYAILLARAMRLVQAEVPGLERIAVSTLGTVTEGSLHGVREFALAQAGDSGAAEAGLTAMLAHIIGLLSTFIGEDLALRLIRGAWPELAAERAAVERREGQG